MSRSTKKPIYKDRGLTTHEYWSPIRHEWKQKTNENYYKDDFYLRSVKAIRNDYDYSDYWFIVKVDRERLNDEFWYNTGWDEEDVKRYSRK